MNEPNTNPTLIAADIARRVPAMAQDSAINNENLILSLIKPAIDRAKLEAEISPEEEWINEFLIILGIVTVIIGSCGLAIWLFA